jgi:hypothetical protein
MNLLEALKMKDFGGNGHFLETSIFPYSLRSNEFNFITIFKNNTFWNLIG